MPQSPGKRVQGDAQTVAYNTRQDMGNDRIRRCPNAQPVHQLRKVRLARLHPRRENGWVNVSVVAKCVASKISAKCGHGARNAALSLKFASPEWPAIRNMNRRENDEHQQK